jgi:outer membrane protein
MNNMDSLKRIIILTVLIVIELNPNLVNASERLTLRDCINIAIKNQPTIIAARENVNAGQGRVIQARSPYLPQVSASTGYVESHSLGGALGDTITKSYSTSLSLNQMLYDFGRSGNTLAAARLSMSSSERDADRVVNDVILNVKQSYYALLAARKLMLVAEKTLDQAESHLRQAEAFFRVGSKPRFDVTRAEVEVNDAKLGIINAKNSLRIRTIGLYNAMGIDPKNEIDVEDVLSTPVAIPAIEQALEESVNCRPEMLKINADIEAAKATVKADESDYLPSLSANGAYNWAHGTAEMGVFRGDIQNSWNAGITLSMPLFDGGITRGKVSEARANLRALEAQRDTLKQSVRIELHQAYADIESATARIAVMESSLKNARDNLQLAQGRYEAGVGVYIEVTDAQVASVNAETNYVQALYDYQLAAARLFKAMGKME